MPLPKGNNRKDCISKSYNEMIAAGKPKEQATAAALNHCNKIYGGIPMKKKVKKEIEELSINIEETLEDIFSNKKELEKQKKFIQKAIKKPGSFTDWCKKQGYNGVTEECIKKGLKSKDKKVQARAKLAIALRNIAKKK